MSGKPIRPEHEITPARAKEWLDNQPQTCLILDCRLPEELETACVCDEPQLLHIPLHELEDRLDELDEALEDRGLDKTAPFAVLCHHGVRSLKATLTLHGHGYSGARSVCGGIEDWACHADPTVPRYTRQGSRCRRVDDHG